MFCHKIALVRKKEYSRRKKEIKKERKVGTFIRIALFSGQCPTHNNFLSVASSFSEFI
jgi:hypothetical protein